MGVVFLKVFRMMTPQVSGDDDESGCAWVATGTHRDCVISFCSTDNCGSEKFSKSLKVIVLTCRPRS